MDSKVTKASNINEISPILDLIHDCWFEVDDIHFTAQDHVLSIKFEKELSEKAVVKEKGMVFKKLEIPVVECYIRFFQVEGVMVNDSEKVGRYDFVGINYLTDEKKIVVTTGVPIEIILKVKDFEVEVEVTENVIKTISHTSVLGG